MLLAQPLPAHTYGFWLPVWRGDEEHTRAIKRIVLRSFKQLIREMKAPKGTLLAVKDFTWVENTFEKDDTFGDPYYKTYGWKAEIISVRLFVS